MLTCMVKKEKYKFFDLYKENLRVGAGGIISCIFKFMEDLHFFKISY